MVNIQNAKVARMYFKRNIMLSINNELLIIKTNIAMTKEFKKRLKQSVEILLAMPFSGKLVGENWEYLLANVCNMDHVPKKLLFDIIDKEESIGLSIKTIFGNPTIGVPAEPIIARGDIFSKADDLGFDELGINDHPQYLGNALIRFWNMKVETDAKTLNIKKKKISILVKSKDLTKFAYFEKNIDKYDENEFEWNWVDNKKLGLHGKLKSASYSKFKWSSREHQLVERWLIPKNAYIFKIEPKHFTMNELTEILDI